MGIKTVVMGGGPGGYVAAVRAAQKGADVVLIEKENVGGTCLNRGCIPSKIMKTAADMMEDFHQAAAFGVAVGATVRADMEMLMARKRKVLQTQITGIEKLLKHHDINLVSGEAKIQGYGKIAVLSPGEESQLLEWDRLVVATGSQPLQIPAFPFDGETVISSNEALCLREVPDSVVIVGGGVIGCEFACILSALGSRVTVVEALSRLLPLPSVDEDCSKVLQREMKKRKIKFLVDRTVTNVTRQDGKSTVTIGPSPFAENLKARDKEPVSMGADKVLVCVGRAPNTAGIGLASIGVCLDKKGWVMADDHMRTNIEHVFAIGDVLGLDKVMLAHVASAEGIVAAENAMGGDQKMSYDVIPGAVFTSPEIANVGLTEKMAAEAGTDVRVESVLFRTIGKAQAMGKLSGQVKIVAEAGSGRVLGVHIVGAHATDLIAEGALAIQTGRTVAEIAGTIHAHPTLAEVMLEVSLKAQGMALHG